jgi:hypothetical protein
MNQTRESGPSRQDLFPSWQTMSQTAHFRGGTNGRRSGQTLELSPYEILERKRITLVKAAIDGLILDRTAAISRWSDSSTSPAPGIRAGGVFGLLNYLGLPVEREPDSFASGRVEIFSAEKALTPAQANRRAPRRCAPLTKRAAFGGDSETTKPKRAEQGRVSRLASAWCAGVRIFCAEWARFQRFIPTRS